MAIKNKFVNQSNNTNYGHKNIIINGDFQVWQRGISFTPSSTGYYTADRWTAARYGWASGITVTKDAYSDHSNINIKRTQGDTSTTGYIVGTSLETIEISKYLGKTLTLQFKHLKGTNYSASTIGVKIFVGTGTDGNYCAAPGTFTNSSTLVSTSVSPSNILQTSSITFTLPSNATQFALLFEYIPTGTAGVNDYFEIGDVQLEVGSFATAFERRPYSIELNLCRRYYWRNAASNTYTNYAMGLVTSSTLINACFQYPVEMRATPSFGYLNIAVGQGGTVTAVSAANIVSPGTQSCHVGLTTSGLSGSTGASGQVVANATTNSYIEFNAEL